MTYTTIYDIEVEWNQGVPTESLGHVARLIEKAERLLARKVPNLAARITAGSLTKEDIVDVVCSMVLRVLRNPAGYRSETAGDYSYQVDAQTGSGRIELLASERRLLLGARAHSIPLVDDALARPFREPLNVSPREWTVPATGYAP